MGHRLHDGGSSLTQVDAKTLNELITLRATKNADDIALIFPEKSYSYAEFNDKIDAIARGIIGLGVEPGDRVGYFLADGPSSLILLFGIMRAGAIVVPINNRFKAFELSKVVAQSGMTALFTTPQTSALGSDYVALLRQAFPGLPVDASAEVHCPELPDLRYIISWDHDSASLMPRADFEQIAKGVSEREVSARGAGVAAADTVLIKYTSGTTGSPKGAMLSHAAILGAARGSVEERFYLTPDDRLWSALPLFHIGGVAFAIACLWAGCPYVHTGFFDPDVALQQLIEHKVTVTLPAFETIWLPVVDHPRWQEVDQTKLRIVACVGTEQRLRDIQSRHPDAVVMSCYGQTEACGYLSLTRPDDSLEVRITTGGHPLPGMEAKIVDPTTWEEIPRNTLGEICYRGPNAFDGYFDAPELNSASWDQDGYFHTGDLGLMDEEGRLTFRDRIKDMLKVGGENVAAAEVEDYLISHPAVRIAQVVSAPDQRYVEVPAAFIECEPGKSVSEAELIDFCRGKIATFRVPRYVRFVKEWPMSGTKIKKFELRERIAEELDKSGIKQAPKVSSV